MGLTVHYTISFTGTEKELTKKLEEIRNACMDLSFEEVGKVKSVSLNLLAGEGCENTNLNFEKHGKKWTCKSFTKTQYAKNFAKCHLLVISLFDMLKENGFEVEIYDESDYWETRDLSNLAKNMAWFKTK